MKQQILTLAAPDQASSKILFTWLLMLRWGSVVCQIILIATVSFFFQIDIPLPVLSGIIVFQALTNLYFYYLQKRKITIPEKLFVLVMFLDATLFTFLLYFTGGPMNPFTFLYLVHVVLGAILMRPTWCWALAMFTILCYASLFFLANEEFSPGLVPQLSTPGQTVCLSTLKATSQIEGHLKLHLLGMWLAFSITTIFIVFFLGRIQLALERHQLTLADLEAAKARNEKLASLATLAAGAAHEFSTPLSTIAVASGEMLHFLKNNDGANELIEDTELIKKQVEHCKEILYQMAADAGEHLGEPMQDFTVRELVDQVLRTFPVTEQNNIKCNILSPDMKLTMPSRTLSRILRGVLRNAFDASLDNFPIHFNCYSDDMYFYFEITDRGQGMDLPTLARATEPFFTSKEPGKGLGLGLFLAKSAAERFGGYIKIKSRTHKGTKVIIALALEKIINAAA